MPKALLDCDAFFASCEQARNPSLRGLPVLISGPVGTRSVVSSASYPAKRKGVKAGMPPEKALELCPGAIIVGGDFSYYLSVHRRMESRLIEMGLDVESSSIDEFYADFRGTYREAHDILAGYSSWVETALGITVSVGLAPTRVLAKLASEIVKPRGMSVLLPESLPAALDGLAVERLLGIGKATADFLHRAGIRTLGQLRQAPCEVLGQMGLDSKSIRAILAGESDSVDEDNGLTPKSVSCRMTLPYDVDDQKSLEHCIFYLADRVSSRMRRHKQCARKLTLILRSPDFVTVQRSVTLKRALYTGFESAEQALRVFRAHFTQGDRVRLIGLCLSGLSNIEDAGLDLPLLPEDRKRLDLTSAMDLIRSRYGDSSLSIASASGIL